MKLVLSSLTLLAMLGADARAAGLLFQSAAEQTVLLELYTSEGCSSCPPAETWLSGLQKSPGLWRDFVPVAFHVDYWDRPGWRDPWSARQFTERQSAYAAQWHSESIYTPGLVLNGREWRDWPGSKADLKPSAARAGVLTVSSTDTNRWAVSFAPAGKSGAAYEVHAALLAGALGSDVKGGENRGRHLNHDFVATTLVSKPLHVNADGVGGEFDLSARPKTTGSSLALAVWITVAGQLKPLQATGGWLVRPVSSH